MIKQWKIPKRIYKNRKRLDKLQKFSFKHEDIIKVANSRFRMVLKKWDECRELYTSPKVLAIKKKEKPSLFSQ